MKVSFGDRLLPRTTAIPVMPSRPIKPNFKPTVLVVRDHRGKSIPQKVDLLDGLIWLFENMSNGKSQHALRMVGAALSRFLVSASKISF